MSVQEIADKIEIDNILEGSNDGKSSIVQDIFKYIQLGVGSLSEERRRLQNSANVKLKIAVIMVLFIFILLFSQQIFRGEESNYRKRERVSKKNRKSKR